MKSTLHTMLVRFLVVMLVLCLLIPAFAACNDPETPNTDDKQDQPGDQPDDKPDDQPESFTPMLSNTSFTTSNCIEQSGLEPSTT